MVAVFALLVGALHFLIGPNYQGPFQSFMSGYLIDIVLPACLYLLFHMSLQQKLPLFLSRFLSALLVLFIGSIVEILQYFDIYVFGGTYDPLDFLMYVLGAGLGWVLDFTVLKHFSIQK